MSDGDASGSTNEGITVQVSFQGKPYTIPCEPDATISDLQSALQVATGVAIDEQRVMIAGEKFVYSLSTTFISEHPR
jgi:hypothetical protein